MNDRLVVTEEMISAGRNVLADYEWGWSDDGEYVSRIYLAMAAARPGSKKTAVVPMNFSLGKKQ